MLSASRRIVFEEAQAKLERGVLLDSTRQNLSVDDASSTGTIEATGDLFTDDSCLPPPLPLREVRLVCPPDLDKQARTLLHGVFREHLPYLSTRAIVPGANVIVSSAGAAGPSDQTAMSYKGNALGGGATGNVDILGDIQVENVTYLEVRHEAFGKVRKSWPAGRGQYLEFTLYKAGRSTLEAVDLLCRRLRVHRSRYAGEFRHLACFARVVVRWDRFSRSWVASQEVPPRRAQTGLVNYCIVSCLLPAESQGRACSIAPKRMIGFSRSALTAHDRLCGNHLSARAGPERFSAGVMFQPGCTYRSCHSSIHPRERCPCLE